MHRIARVGLAATALTLALGIPGLAQAEPTTPAPAPAATQTQAPRVTITEPSTKFAPAYITVTGLADGQRITTYSHEDSVIESQQKGSDPLRVRIPAPRLGWTVDMRQLFTVELPGGATREVTFIYNGGGDIVGLDPQPPQAGQSISVTAPATVNGPVMVTIKGLAKGDAVDVRGWRKDKADDPDYGFTMVQQGTGPLTNRVEPPQGGWKAGVEYTFQVVFPDGGIDTARFVAPGAPKPAKNPTTKPAKTNKPSTTSKPSKPTKPAAKGTSNRGLAKTGV
ncbi:MAG: hypothetical protein Q4G46_07065 [Propionibacteriaceae bacterium]|nr:hypothetical protein [Propionibacteriaceae bacterium]